MNGSSVFSPPPESVVTPQKRRPSCPLMSNARSFSSRAGLSQVPRPFGQCPPLPTSYSVSLSDPFALDVGRLVLPERKRRICNQRDDHEVANDRPIHRPSLRMFKL